MSATSYASALHFLSERCARICVRRSECRAGCGWDDVRDAIARAEALTAARESEDFAAISAAFKRIKNILRQAEEKGFAIGSSDGVKLAPEAQNLSDAAAALAPEVAKLRERASVWRGAGEDCDAPAGGRCLLRQGDGA